MRHGYYIPSQGFLSGDPELAEECCVLWHLECGSGRAERFDGVSIVVRGDEQRALTWIVHCSGSGTGHVRQT